MTQEFHLSITPIHDYEYLIRTEQVPDGAQLAESLVIWPVEDWLIEASRLMDDPLMGLLRSGSSEDLLMNGSSAHHFLSSSRRSPSENLIAFGQQLYNALFQGSIQESWMRAQGIAQHQRSRLRFRLGLKGTELHRLPWEVMYAGDRPLASGTGVVFSRYHSSFSVLKSRFPFAKTPSREPHPPLKILMVLATPNDQEMLALKQEAEYLQHELQKTSSQDGEALLPIELTILEQPGREQLTQALEHNHYQVLHYAGHSDLGASGGSLYLVNRKTGLTELLSGDDLAGLLVNNGIRMAVFNSCRGVYSATSEADQEGNLAEALVRRGIPAVLAMAERIPDDVALHLSQLFYRNLKQALPVDLSLNRTRQGLITSFGSDQLYWALPILYLHPEFDGYVLPVPDSITASTMSLDFPLVGGEEGESESSLELPTVANQPEAVLASARNGRSQISKPSEQWAANYASVVQAHTTGNLSDSDYFQEADFVEEDPDPPEEERVVRLAYEVSQSPTILEPEETDSIGLHDEHSWGKKTSPDYSALLDTTRSQPLPPPPASPISSTSQNSNSVGNGTETQASLEDVLDVLKNIMGRSTEKMMAAQQAVQSDPTSAEAFTQLGWALFQQGYPKEAKIAYYRAIRLNPTYADAYSRLGVALHQQGEVKEAIQVFNRAVELDSSLGDAPTILRNLVQDDTPAGISPNPILPKPQPSLPKPSKKHFARKPQRAMIWVGLIAAGLSVVVAARLFDRQLIQFRDWLYSPTSTGSPFDVSSSNQVEDLSKVDTPTLQAIATNQIKQGNMAAVPVTIAALLDRRALQEAAAVLQQIPSQQANTPAINFLKGKMAWQQWLAGNKDYSVAQARELWEVAARDESNALYQNALGFAYYAEGQWDRAEQAWWRALQSSGGTTSPQAPQPGMVDNSTSLTSYAGLAMASLKKADSIPPDQQKTLRAEALKLRQRVLDADQVNFQPDALSKNWMWSEKAIQDWRSLLQQS